MPSTEHFPHQVYPYEFHGNTLVVRPRGDCVGFALHQVRREMGEIHTLAADEVRVAHLLIDLSAEHYFGSMVLGDLVEFGQTVKARGGRIGLCGASDDFLAVLKLMHLDAQWEIFPNTAAALQAVATIPWWERAWDYRHVAAALTAVCLMMAVITFWPQSDRGPKYARELLAMWEAHHRPSVRVSTEERLARDLKVQSRLDPMVKDLMRIGRRRRLTELEWTVLHSARPWLWSMQRGGQEAEVYYAQAVSQVEVARGLLGDGTISLAAVPLMDIVPPPIDGPASAHVEDSAETAP